MKRLKRIQKIYELRVEIARRETAAAQQARLALEGAHAQIGETLNAELDGCDSIERAPFDFAARYYRASVDRMRVKQGEIAGAVEDELAASQTLRQRYKEQKEFDVYAARCESAHDEEVRRKTNEEARRFFDGGPNDFAAEQETRENVKEQRPG